MFSLSAEASVRNNLAAEAQDAIYQFFFTSGRKVQKVKIENYLKMSAAGLDYLVEAEVFAESYATTQFVEYHCGVFVKKNNRKWEAQQTACEAIPGASVLQ